MLKTKTYLFKIIVISAFFSTLHTHPISISIDSPDKDHLGYGNCDALTNGEHVIIKHFIKEGDTAIDAGAHVGDWSHLVLQHTNNNCIIHAFEPVPDFFTQLTKRLKNKIHCYNLALGKEEIESVMNYCKKNGDWSSLFDRPVFCEVPVEKITIQMTSLDTFCQQNMIDHINFLKIDTEGYEWEVLKGANALITDNKIDIIQFEYGGTYPDAGITLHLVYTYLKSKGYIIFRIVPDGLIHIPAWREKLENSEYSNYVAVLEKSEKCA